MLFLTDFLYSAIPRIAKIIKNTWFGDKVSCYIFCQEQLYQRSNLNILYTYTGSNGYILHFMGVWERNSGENAFIMTSVS